MVERGSREGSSLSEKAHCGGPLGRAPLLRTLEDMLKRLWTRASLSIGAPIGEAVGDSLAWTFERKELVYLGSFLGPRGH